jgi:carnitine O-acetyltransferase
MPAESVGRGDRRKVLDSTAFKYLFHGCRVPEPEQDSYRIYDPALHHHAVVARKGHFFALDFCDPVTAEPYPVQVLEEGLQEIVERAEEMEAKNYPKLGWLTSSHRDDWAAARQELFGLSCDNMTAALELLQSGAILICLDDDEPVSRAEVANQLLTGSLKTGCNRWFDKSIQIIITDNGKAGLMGEHSMMDGMPVLSYADLMTKTTYQRCRANATKPVSDATSNVRPVFTGEMLRNMSADRLVEKGKQLCSLVSKESVFGVVSHAILSQRKTTSRTLLPTTRSMFRVSKDMAAISSKRRATLPMHTSKSRCS